MVLDKNLSNRKKNLRRATTSPIKDPYIIGMTITNKNQTRAKRQDNLLEKFVIVDSEKTLENSNQIQAVFDDNQNTALNVEGLDDILQIQRSSILTNPFLTDENFSEYQEYLRSYRSRQYHSDQIQREVTDTIEEALFKLESSQSSAMSTSSDFFDSGDSPACPKGVKELKKKTKHLESPKKSKVTPTVVLNNDMGLLLPAQPVRRVPSKSAFITKVQRSSQNLYDSDEGSYSEVYPVTLFEKIIKPHSRKKFTSKLEEAFINNVFLNKNESLHKYYKVRSSYMSNGDNQPMLAIMSDTTLYFVALNSLRSYCNLFVIPLAEVDFILVSMINFICSN